MMDLTGRKFGKYELIENLGHGGMAEVYKAHQPGLDRFVAIKLMHRHLANSPDFVSRFKREAKSIGQLQHAHILHVIDFDVENGIYYIVMDYIQGDTLGDYLQKVKALPVDEALSICVQLVDAVDYAHRRGVIHRDIKPGNVMFMDDSHARVVLTDFGMARLLDDTGLTLSGTLIGTPAYMSPEAARAEHVDERTDIYSLGVVLYEMVTGRTPYTGDTPVSIILKQASEPLPSPRKYKPDLPEPVEKLLFKALAKEPRNRFESAAEFKQAVRQVQVLLDENSTLDLSPLDDADQTVVSRSPSLRPIPAKQKQESSVLKQLLLLAAAGGGILLVAVLIILWLIFGRQSGTADQGPALAADPTAASRDASSPNTLAGLDELAVGFLRFADSETVRAGNFILDMEGIISPPAGSHYELWLADDNNAAMINLVGQLVVNNGRIRAEGSTEQNLLGTYSQAIVSIEPDNDPDPAISNEIAFSGSLPSEFLQHLRQVTFEEPANQKGFLPGAEEQLLVAISHAGFAQEALAAGNLDGARRHAEHVVNILEGKGGPHYGDLDGDGLGQNPGDGFGVRPYLENAIEQVQGAAEIPTGSGNRQQSVDRFLNTGSNHLNSLDQAIERALQIFAADTAAEAQPFADDVSELLDQVSNGTDLDGNGAIDPTKNEGGIQALYQSSMLMGEIVIFARE